MVTERGGGGGEEEEGGTTYGVCPWDQVQGFLEWWRQQRWQEGVGAHGLPA